jgi:hypothetical protein
MNPEFQSIISTFLTPFLIAIVAFFLKGLMERFNKLEQELRTFLIQNAHFEQRLITLENRMRVLDELVLNAIKARVHD